MNYYHQLIIALAIISPLFMLLCVAEAYRLGRRRGETDARDDRLRQTGHEVKTKAQRAESQRDQRETTTEMTTVWPGQARDQARDQGATQRSDQRQTQRRRGQ